MAESLQDSSESAHKPASYLTPGEKLTEAQKYKEEGNTLYKKKNLKGAIRNYHLSLLYIKGIENQHKQALLYGIMEPVPKLPAELEREVKNLKVACFNNLAACLLQKESPNCGKVIEYCNQVLENSPMNAKALYRKGMAYYHLKDYDKAKTLLQEATQLSDCTDPNMQRHIQLCDKQLEKYKQKEKELYRAMFNASENSPSSA